MAFEKKNSFLLMVIFMALVGIIKNEFTPLKLQEKSVRGTISNRLKQAIKN
ncbi:type I-F CRISPR-associated protein Cas7f/Csy3, partial [Shigella sp. FC1967]|uniref:type I-F CRISPR-associated protein Cas7f/Csy3 n=1 Tax=Shigella sp. FC1967 TaxID=1898041 RepID=UPI0010082137